MTSLELNTPHVACDVAEGEALLIHFRSGRYFSARGAAAELLHGALAGTSCAALLQQVGQTYGERIRQQAENFLADLVRYELVRETADRPTSQPLQFSAPPEQVELEVHTDLEDLLKLDPIHDASDQGWPLRA
jgi:hypothetical protein